MCEYRSYMTQCLVNLEVEMVYNELKRVFINIINVKVFFTSLDSKMM